MRKKKESERFKKWEKGKGGEMLKVGEGGKRGTMEMGKKKWGKEVKRLGKGRMEMKRT